MATRGILTKVFAAVSLLVIILVTSEPVAARITSFECSFKNVNKIYFTIYSDGTPARVGVSVGVGNKALLFEDKFSGALIFIETNIGDIPISMTTISPSLKAVHSRQLIHADGEVVGHSQGNGTCKDIPIR